MSHSVVLSEIQIEEIRKLAERTRQSLGFVGDTPIANDIFTILDNEGILLLEYPIKSEGEKPAFSAALMYSKEGNKELAFIGLNTADYFDKQIFAIAHELYHYYTKTGSHLSRPSEEENDLIEKTANRFAAEFLLPESNIKSIVLKEFKISSLEKKQTKTLLRFIARLQCTWWLPYRSLVKRLKEINAISDDQYYKLFAIDERDMAGEYGRMGRAINEEVFLKLNKATNNIGTSPKDIEIIIRNFEDELIDEDKFTNTLALFNKNPDDFGYEFEVSDEDIEEFEEFFNGEVGDES
ncbi:ImmA/IrrE family metallo-endopeptidase [Gudongella oleilytica]|jgi:Zn-dependent peptidase ImmA (M78 family)|uniref:ImmA/IrrE family metallo-endopeptidase n=1 Tax=Gudongella oleilytica TaxID=1582259 RepID=UPI000FF8B016|nr:ImmA/IrrE family metallo-endopeptidase [Gudongella oleilytica]